MDSSKSVAGVGRLSVPGGTIAPGTIPKRYTVGGCIGVSGASVVVAGRECGV